MIFGTKIVEKKTTQFLLTGNFKEFSGDQSNNMGKKYEMLVVISNIVLVSFCILAILFYSKFVVVFFG